MITLRNCRFVVVLGAALAGAALSMTACGTKGPDGNSSVAASSISNDQGSKLPLAAKLALDSGNAAYRAKQMDVALDKFRQAAEAAPMHAAPWFGIYMVASETKNAALADSAMARVRALSGDKASLDAHAQVTAAPKGLLPPPTTSTLPAGHPTADAAPAGHPKYKLVSPDKIDSVKRTKM